MQTIKTALLSFGMSGQVFHAPFLHKHPGFTLVGSWERSKKQISDSYPGTRSYASLESILEDPELDLVIVNTPTYTHYDYTKKVIEAGKHAVVEKAFTTTAKEAIDLQTLASQKNRRLAVFQNRRWDSDFQTVKSVINEGLIGRVVEATLAYARYDPNLSPKSHKENPGPGAGILKDLGPHLIDQALVLFGIPQGVFADIGITRQRSLVDDYVHLLLRYERIHVHIKAGYFYREPLMGYTLHGTRGSLLKSRADVQESQLKAGIAPTAKGYGIEPVEERGLLHTALEGKTLREHIDTLPGNYMAFYEDLYHSITTNAPEPVTAQEGVNVMRVLDAAVTSWEEQRMIYL